MLTDNTILKSSCRYGSLLHACPSQLSQRQSSSKSMSSITIWGRRSSFNVQKVLWVLDLLQLTYHHIEIGGKFGGLDTSEFESLNPHKKVSVLREGDLVIWESHTIIRYLAAKYSPSTLWRETPSERTYIDRWLDWTATRLQPDFMTLFWVLPYAKSERAQKTIQQAKEKCNYDYALLNRYLQDKRFLCGDELTLADIPPGATLHRYFTMGADVAKPANVIAYYQRLCGTEAYRRSIMSPYEELFGRSIF